MQPSIKKNFAYSAVLTISNYILPLLVYPYVSRVLGVDKFGLCNFIDSIINYFILFSMMGISVVGIREIAKHKSNKEELMHCFQDIFALNLLFTLAMLVLLIVATYTVPQLSEHKDMMFIGAIKLIFNIFLIEWFYRGVEEFKYITIRSIVVKLLYVIAVLALVSDASDYKLYFACTAGAIVVNAMLNWGYLRQFIKMSFRDIRLFRYWKTICIMGFYHILTTMYKSFNIVYLGFAAGETEVGYYTTATILYTGIMGLFTAFTGVMLPRMSALVSEGKMDEFVQLTNKSHSILFKFAFPLICFSEVFAPHIIQIVSGAGYEGAITPMRIVMPLMLVIGYEQILIIQTLMPLKKDREVLINSVAGAAVGLLLNIILVHQLKSTGAAIVWVTSELVVLCFAQHWVKKYINSSFPTVLFLGQAFEILPLAMVFVLVNHYVTSTVYHGIIVASFFLCGYYALQFKEVFSKFKAKKTNSNQQ